MFIFCISKLLRTFLVLAFLTLPLLAREASSAPVPIDPGFEVETVVTGLNIPTSLAIAPDGRIFITEKSGTVRIVKNGLLLEIPFISLTDVNNYGDRGLHSVALDPDFSENGFVYLLYAHENTPGTGLTAAKTGRLVRVTAVGDTASESTKVVILGTVGGTFEQPSCEDFEPTADCLPADSQAHSVGALRFRPDGTLYVSVGDGAHFSFADPAAMRAQDLDRPSGKILRINTDGTAPSDNPFFNGDPSANRSKVWMYGLRYPYRFGIRPTNGSLYIGDVGWRSWEEVNSNNVPGSNFGWPCREGFFPTEHDCEVENASDPIHAYSTTQGAAVIGGGFPGESYPAEYRDSFFFGDFVKDHIRRMILDENGAVASIETFVTGAGGPVDFHIGPDGDIYYIAILVGGLRRIVHAADNRRPIAVISAEPTAGLTPLEVSFSSGGSFDPDGDLLTFEWDFGDGGDSSEGNPTYTYNEEGIYTTTLRVSDPEGRFDIKSETITVGNRAPVGTIESPSSSVLYEDHQIIELVGSGVDPEDGELPESAFSWEIILHHNVHIHFLEELTGKTPSFGAPDHGSSDVYVEVILTVEDSEGLSHSTSINVYHNNSPFEEGQNLVINQSLETVAPTGTEPLNWRKGGFGDNRAVMTYPVAGYNGGSAARIDVSEYTSGDRKWYFDPIWVTPGKEYYFSDYYQSDVPTRITVQYGRADGSFLFVNLGTVDPASTWTKVEHTFIAPPEARTATVFHGIRAVGFLEVDDYWFGLLDLTPPDVFIAMPGRDATVSGTVTAEAVALDNAAVAGVAFLVDGVEQVVEDLESPYILNLDTTTLSDGAHIIAARAWDFAGNTTMSGRIRFFVQNQPTVGENAIRNSSVEVSFASRPEYWKRGQFGVHEATFTYPVPGFDGEDAVKIDMTAHTSGQARWVFEDVPVEPGREYIFSDYYKSTVPNAVRARFMLSDGSYIYPLLGWVEPSEDWKPVGFSFVVPSDVISVTIFHSLGLVGTLETDQFSLKPSGNLVVNPSTELEFNADTSLAWRRGRFGDHDEIFSYPAIGVTGSGVRVKIENHTSGDAKWYSEDIPVIPGQTYIVSDYYKSTVETTMKVRIRRQDGSFRYPLLGQLQSTASWLRAEFPFTAPEDAVSISIFHFVGEVGTLTTDEFSVRKAIE